MNFKKNFKRFFTLSRNAEGFTLVELIVVIAILGILTTVAVPAYSQYVGSAQTAKERQQLGVVNSALAVACAMNHVSTTEIGTPTLNPANGIVTVTEGEKASEITAEYAACIAGNTIKFEKINPEWNGSMFIDPTDGGPSGGAFTDKFNSLSDDTGFQTNVNTVKGSIFGQIGASGLMNKVNDVTNIATDLANFKNPDGSQPHAGLLTQYAEGMITDLGLNEESYMSMVNNKMEELRQQGVPYADEDELFSKAQNELLANYAVLVAAKNTAGKEDADLLTTLRTEFTSSDLKGMVKNGGESMAQAAMIYGMYTAYANGLPDSDPNKAAALEKAKDPDAFLEAYSDSGFQAYLNDDSENAQVKEDLAAYKAAMGIINSGMSGEDKTAATQLVTNGFTDPDLLAALNGLLG